MMVRRSVDPWSVSIAALLSIAALSPLAATEAPEERPPNETFTAAGKYKELIGDQLYLVNDPREFHLKEEDHLRRVLELTSHRDNLKLSGVVVSTVHGKVLEVRRLEVGASDVEIFREKKAAAIRAPDATRADVLLELALEAVAHGRQYDEPRILELSRESLELGFSSLTAGATSETLDVTATRIVEVRDVPGSEPIAIGALNELEQRFPRRAEITRAARSLGCRRHDGRWVGYQEFKKLEGFVWHAGRWMKPHDKDRIEAIDAFRRSLQSTTVLRRRTEREYSLLAERGVSALGMRPEEVAKALGFPERVERRLLAQKEFAQWIYEGDEYYYFYDGYLVRKTR